MTSTSLTEQQLTDIEARAGAATPGPWGVYQFGGDSLIEIAADLEDTGTGYTARRTVARFDEEPMDNDPSHAEWSAEEDWAQVLADAEFVAHAREDVTALAAQVRRLQQQRKFLITQLAKRDAESGNADRALREFLGAADPICGDANDGDWCELEPGHEGNHRADTAEWPAAPAATDTLPAWLYSRFNDTLDGPAWDRLTDEDRTYWAHQARAVRRAVARGGFKVERAATVPAAVETGE